MGWQLATRSVATHGSLDVQRFADRRSRAIEVWKFDGREVLRYPHAANLSIVRYEDITGDGRPDLKLEGARWAESLPDGTFRIREAK